MSGIIGILNLDLQPVESLRLHHMISTLAHRGPDASRIWNQGPVGLGNCALHTTPESHLEALPRTSSDRQLAITSDARIDNREELISLLSLESSALHEFGDGEIILRAYQEWGQECTRYLLGDFSFAIWDQRKRLLFCARDHFGVKPFYYYRSDKFFAFSSEIKALLALKEVPRCLNEGRIADYLVPSLEGVDKDSTFYRHIFRLPPCSSLLIGSERFAQSQYWSPDQDKTIRFATPEEYSENFYEILKKSVACRLRSDSPKGSTLSGGLDSSAITAVSEDVLQQLNLPLHTFSAVSDDENDPESRCINLALNKIHAIAVKIRPADIVTLQDDLDRALEGSEDPFDSHMTLMEVLFVSASKKKIRVLLDGIDGDIVASPSSQYIALLLRSLQLATAFKEISYASRNGAGTFLSILSRNFRIAFVPDPLRRVKRSLSKQDRLNHAIRNTFISMDFAKKIKLDERLEKLHAYRSLTGIKTIQQANVLDVLHPYVSTGFERYDRVASAHSMEPRHPFFDKRLIEFLIAIPWEEKTKGGWSKYILRNALTHRLPKEIRFRKCSDHLGQQFTLVRMSLLENKIEHTIKNDLPLIADFVDLAKVHSSFDRGAKERTLEDRFTLWETFYLIRWMKTVQSAKSCSHIHP